MLISFDCPKCLKTTRGEDASQVVHCKSCGWTRQTSEPAKDESLSSCLVCGCADLWRQKDFDQRLGVFIVGIGILLSTVAVAYMMPGVAMIILMILVKPATYLKMISIQSYTRKSDEKILVSFSFNLINLI